MSAPTLAPALSTYPDAEAGVSIPAARAVPAALDPLVRTQRRGRGYGHAVGPALLRGSDNEGPVVVGVPIERVSAVEVSARPVLTGTHQISGLEGASAVIEAAARATADLILARAGELSHLGVSGMDMKLKRRSDVQVGVGAGSSSADAAAVVRALSAAWHVELTDAEVAGIVAEAHKSTGAGVFSGGVWPGIAPLRPSSGEVLAGYSWWPRLALVVVVARGAALGRGEGTLALSVEDTTAALAQLRRASESRDTAGFVAAGHAIALRGLKGDQARSELGDLLLEQAEKRGALGLLGCDPADGIALVYEGQGSNRTAAFSAVHALREAVGPGLDIWTTITRPAPE